MGEQNIGRGAFRHESGDDSGNPAALGGGRHGSELGEPVEVVDDGSGIDAGFEGFVPECQSCVGLDGGGADGLAVEKEPESGALPFQSESAVGQLVGEILGDIFAQFGAGFFGGEGFLMRKFSGTGLVFLEIDGSAHDYDIPAGSCKIVDTGYLAAMSESCSMEIRSVKGLKNMLFGGEGFFNTAVKGPGRIILQSMPISSTATVLYQFMPHSSH